MDQKSLLHPMVSRVVLKQNLTSPFTNATTHECRTLYICNLSVIKFRNIKQFQSVSFHVGNLGELLARNWFIKTNILSQKLRTVTPVHRKHLRNYVRFDIHFCHFNVYSLHLCYCKIFSHNRYLFF